MKLVDTPSWGGGANRCAGSNPVVGTRKSPSVSEGLFLWNKQSEARFNEGYFIKKESFANAWLFLVLQIKHLWKTERSEVIQFSNKKMFWSTIKSRLVHRTTWGNPVMRIKNPFCPHIYWALIESIPNSYFPCILNSEIWKCSIFFHLYGNYPYF